MSDGPEDGALAKGLHLGDIVHTTYRTPSSHRLLDKLGKLPWEVSRAPHVHTCELRDHCGLGVKAQILKDGEIGILRRFDRRDQAVHWAVRGGLEKGA